MRSVHNKTVTMSVQAFELPRNEWPQQTLSVLPATLMAGMAISTLAHHIPTESVRLLVIHPLLQTHILQLVHPSTISALARAADTQLSLSPAQCVSIVERIVRYDSINTHVEALTAW